MGARGGVAGSRTGSAGRGARARAAGAGGGGGWAAEVAAGLAGGGSEGEGRATEAARAALRGFGRVRQAPKRAYTLPDLRLNNIDAAGLLSPEDKSLAPVRTGLRVAAGAGFLATVGAFGLDAGQALGLLGAVGFAAGVDLVGFGGGLSFLVEDTAGRLINPSYADRVAFHEAGHFLVAYAVGLLPRGYTLSSLDALRSEGALSVQAGCLFCDSGFQAEVARGTVTAETLGVFTCTALGGVAAEYVQYGQAEGGRADLVQLDQLLGALGFTERKTADQVRWGALNAVQILRQNARAHRALARAMLDGADVVECIQVIERELDPESLLRREDEPASSQQAPTAA